MNGIETLQSRNGDNLIKKAFIEKVLNEEAENMKNAQDRILSNLTSTQKIDLIEFSRKYTVTDATLHHEHHIQQRFIDMKRTRYGKQKPVKIHNSIIYGHFNNIIFKLKYNLTEQIRAQLGKDLNIELYG
ncbi:hypothetical protein JM79_3248 [Gramella sp. Hel_I_59]|uniref:hypothetical protein n=1 Tax=Gramella sp. Hel_I_59 TaxID=1249978 RepID=UPI001152B5D2|nr:hypothetical protein [Gramella sp. Hel_I_59]TQI72290.1 hypothetical protein JM79_3248 [Gramella sp. Hel_I_59]